MKKLPHIPLIHFLFFLLFGWISFFPHPLQTDYKLALWWILCIYLAVIIRERSVKEIFSISRDWPILVYLVTLFSGIVGTNDKALALQIYFDFAIPAALLYFIGKGLLKDSRDATAICITISICCAAVVIFGLFELISGKNFIYEYFITNPFYRRYTGTSPRMMSTQFNPAILGSYCLWSVPFAFYLIRRQKIFLRILGWLAGTLSVAGIFFSFSRGVFVAFIFIIFLCLWFVRSRKAALICAVVVLATIFVFSIQGNSLVNRYGMKKLVIGTHDSIISDYRLERLKITARIFNTAPVFGIGYTQFRKQFEKYSSSQYKDTPYEFRIPDNMYLCLLAETGIIGTIGMLAFFLFLLVRSLCLYNKLSIDWKKDLLLCAVLSLSGLLVNMGAYELFYWTNTYLLLCLAAGLVAALINT